MILPTKEIRRQFPFRESGILPVRNLRELLEMEHHVPPLTTRSTHFLGEGRPGDGGILSELGLDFSPSIMIVFDLRPSTEFQLIDTEGVTGLPSHLLFAAGEKDDQGRIALDQAETTIDLAMNLYEDNILRPFQVSIAGVVVDSLQQKRTLGIKFDKFYQITDGVDLSLIDGEAKKFPMPAVLDHPVTLDSDPSKTSAVVTKRMAEIAGNPARKITWVRNRLVDLGKGYDLKTNGNNLEKIPLEVKNHYAIETGKEHLTIVLNGQPVKTIPMFFSI